MQKVSREQPIQIAGAAPAGQSAAVTLAKAGRRVAFHKAVISGARAFGKRGNQGVG